MPNWNPRDFPFWHPRRASGRVLLALGIGALLYGLMPGQVSAQVRGVAAWNAGGLVLLALAWRIIFRHCPEDTHRVAAAEDPGASVVWALVLASSAVSLFAAAVVMRQAHTLAIADRELLGVLCGVTVVESWVMTHTAYTLRYAHLYYRDDQEGVGGLEVPGGTPPDYLDFAYLAFTVGMCFQVSDICISSRQIRHTVLGHALLAFAYNTAILALALNLVIGAFS